MGMELSEASIRVQPLIHQKWLFLADKLERQPDLLGIALENIESWIKGGRLGDTQMLEQWKQIIEAARADRQGMEALLQLLREESEEVRSLKSCSPFAGVLTREERDQFTCAWSH
jgi:hypothetical protein